MTPEEKYEKYQKFVEVAKRHQAKGYNLIMEHYDDRPQVQMNYMGIICPHCKKGIFFDYHLEYPIKCCGETFE